MRRDYLSHMRTIGGLTDVEIGAELHALAIEEGITNGTKQFRLRNVINSWRNKTGKLPPEWVDRLAAKWLLIRWKRENKVSPDDLFLASKFSEALGVPEYGKLLAAIQIANEIEGNKECFRLLVQALKLISKRLKDEVGISPPTYTFVKE